MGGLQHLVIEFAGRLVLAPPSPIGLVEQAEPESLAPRESGLAAGSCGCCQAVTPLSTPVDHFTHNKPKVTSFFLLALKKCV